MSAAVASSTRNSSADTSYVDGVEDIHKQASELKDHVKYLLKSRIFLGRYVERRLADPRIGYRDIVLISPAEVELKRDLIDAQNKLYLARSVFWVGITDGEPIGYPSNICIWTEIDNQPFGPFWFQIKSVKFREDEFIVMLKCIRHISDSYLEIEPILMGIPKKAAKVPFMQADSTEAIESHLSETYKEIAVNLKRAFTFRNLKEFITFLIAFVIAIFTGSTALINFMGNFVLALIREMSIFVKNSTPMFLGILDCISKVIGGFYILLAMFFRPSNPDQRQRPIRRRAIGNNTQYRTDRYQFRDCNDMSFD